MKEVTPMRRLMILAVPVSLVLAGCASGGPFNRARPDEFAVTRAPELMAARREVKAARLADDVERLANARSAVDAAKTALGERGPVWWQDGAKDFNRHLVKNTPYRDW